MRLALLRNRRDAAHPSARPREDSETSANRRGGVDSQYLFPLFLRSIPPVAPLRDGLVSARCSPLLEVAPCVPKVRPSPATSNLSLLMRTVCGIGKPKTSQELPAGLWASLASIWAGIQRGLRRYWFENWAVAEPPYRLRTIAAGSGNRTWKPFLQRAASVDEREPGLPGHRPARAPGSRVDRADRRTVPDGRSHPSKAEQAVS